MPDRIGLVIYPGREDAARRAAEAVQWLQERGYAVFDPAREEKPEGPCRMILTFGGDGTLLSGAVHAIRYRCPLLGINLGTVGFLTEGDPERLTDILGRLIRREFRIEERELLKVGVRGNPHTWFVLNDAVVTRGGFARLIQVDTFIGKEPWGTFTADGVIAATPTGSTGYSLSAGGPVVAPEMHCIIVTPVCPHSLLHCPCIVPPDSEIRFRLRPERQQRAELQIDGQNKCTLQAGDEVLVTGAKETLKLIRLGPSRFFQLTQQKLSEWSQCTGREEDRP